MIDHDAPTRRRLILVDDEPVILDLLRTVFRDAPYQVVPCATGTAAVAEMERGVDVLLTDKNLPDVGGIELIRHARALVPDVECLILTGYPNLETALSAMQLEVFDYIVKPPKDIFEIRRKVQQAFDKQAMGRQNRFLTQDLQRKNGELQRALDELRGVQAELIQSEKLAGIGTLAAGVAHEISSPLFGIMGLAEAILDEEDPALVRRYATDIVEYSRSIKDIVVDLSGYSRAADAEYLTTVDLRQVIEDAVRLVTRSLRVEGSRVVVEVPEGLYVNARTSEVQQVYVNLVKNALQAVGEHGGGEVRVRAGRGPGHVWTAVEDDGPGIPTDRQALIFDPFYTTKAPGSGTGLGLNIVYRIVTRYRGTVAVESVPGEGAVFHVRFPVDTEPLRDA